METFKDLLKTPLIAIKKAKKKKDIGETINILLVSWILCGISFFIVGFREGISLITISGFSISVFLLGILGTMLVAYFIYVIMNVLGGKGRYFAGLTSVTYSCFPLSFGAIITAFLYLLHPALGVILGFIIMGAFAALGLSLLYKTIKELFTVDIITSWIGISLLILAIVITIYAVILFYPGVLTEFLTKYTIATS
jgi:hypothetical protein